VAETDRERGARIVVKSLDFAPGRKSGRPVQPAINCPGAEYLRIIYGPE
jgi:hypothetical protein